MFLVVLGLGLQGTAQQVSKTIRLWTTFEVALPDDAFSGKGNDRDS